MLINIEKNRTGFSLRIDGNHWNADPCLLRFPEKVWSAFSFKDALIDELAYVTTMATPLMLQHGRVRYNRPEPRFLGFYNDCFMKTVPNLVQDIPHESTEGVREFFSSINREFRDPGHRESFSPAAKNPGKKVVIPFSFGKDSLLSLGTLMALGYEPVPVVIDERVLPRAFAEKKRLAKKLEKQTGIRCHFVTNEIQLLSDYEVLGVPETRVYQVQAYLIHLLAMLPFCEFYNAKTIVLNNEYVNTLAMTHREGARLPYRFMQCAATTAALRSMTEELTGGAVTVANLIGGLGNFAINQVLHERFPGPGKLRISCHIELSRYARWCHECPRCAQAYLMLDALGHKPRQLSFKRNMLTMDNAGFFNIFKMNNDGDEYREYNAMEERLAFSMLERRHAVSPLARSAAESFPSLSDDEFMSAIQQAFGIKGDIPQNGIQREAFHFYKEITGYFIEQAPRRFGIG